MAVGRLLPDATSINSALAALAEASNANARALEVSLGTAGGIEACSRSADFDISEIASPVFCFENRPLLWNLQLLQYMAILVVTVVIVMIITMIDIVILF